MLVLLETVETAPVEEGGTCTGANCEPYVIQLPLTNGSATYSYAWDQLRGMMPRPPNPAQLLYLSFHIIGNPGQVENLELWLDNVGFFGPTR
jgi:hypothetical protein